MRQGGEKVWVGEGAKSREWGMSRIPHGADKARVRRIKRMNKFEPNNDANE